jgi:hypothetical protein
MGVVNDHVNGDARLDSLILRLPDTTKCQILIMHYIS